jgi:transducin (beta)-like 1
VETHFKNDDKSRTCKSGFSLLEPHTCSPNPPSSQPKSPVAYIKPDAPYTSTPTRHSTIDATAKRKAPSLLEEPPEKRPRIESSSAQSETHSLGV